MVFYPHCERKTMKLDITTNSAKCIRCKKEYGSVEEVLKIVEADYIESHKRTDIEMRSNRGGF
jgi:hypothetical protein